MKLSQERFFKKPDKKSLHKAIKKRNKTPDVLSSDRQEEQLNKNYYSRSEKQARAMLL